MSQADSGTPESLLEHGIIEVHIVSRAWNHHDAASLMFACFISDVCVFHH